MEMSKKIYKQMCEFTVSNYFITLIRIFIYYFLSTIFINYVNSYTILYNTEDSS